MRQLRFILALAAAVAASSAIARPVRVDLAIAPQFANSGELWTQDFDVSADLGGDAYVSGAVAFDLNFGGGAAAYNFCFTENGYVSFVQAPGCNSLLPPGGDFIAAFANDIEISEAMWSVGSIDTEAAFVLGEAVPAMRFTWRGTDSTGSLLFAQLVLLNQGDGDFDIELNYGGPFATDYATSTAGGQGLSLGENEVPLVTGAFNGPTTYFFRMVDGVLTGGGNPDPDPDPTPVPEPGSISLFAAALLALAFSLRRRLSKRAPVRA